MKNDSKISNPDDWETHWLNFSDSTEKIPSHQFRRVLISRILSKEVISKANLIDFGSGQGDLIHFISSKFNFNRLVGLELTKTGVKISKKKVLHATFIQKNLLESAEVDQRTAIKKLAYFADYGLCLEVLEHLDEPKKFLNNIRYYLKKNAKLIITVPGGKMCAFERHIGHRKHYTKNELGNLLRDCGYKNFTIQSTGFPFFNLYKIITIIRGKKLIDDVKKNKKTNLTYYLSRIVMKIFELLFKLNLNFLPLGWQLIAVVKIK